MQLDAADLADFYEGPLGLLTRRIIARHLRAIWPSAKGDCLLGYGFAVPYLRQFQAEAERVVALMPAQQGVVVWPSLRPLTALGVGWDRLLRRIVPGLAGVHIVEATKTFYGAVPARVGRTVPQWLPARDAQAALNKTR